MDCALQALSDFTGGTGVGEVIANPIAGTITQCATLNIGPEFKDQYLGYYAAREVRLPPAVKFGVGVVMTEDMLVEQRELRCSEIYNDLLRPFDIPHFMFAWVRKSESKVQTIAIEGTLSHGAFDERAVARFPRSCRTSYAPLACESILSACGIRKCRIAKPWKRYPSGSLCSMKKDKSLKSPA